MPKFNNRCPEKNNHRMHTWERPTARQGKSSGWKMKFPLHFVGAILVSERVITLI